ncbi:MAG: response regulator [Azospirillum sp.]|nr:response regulator [Azospirillum sp.]
MTASRLLVVDDDAEVGKYVASVAKLCGYDVKTVSLAVEFRRRLEDWRPSHIVLDLQMPDCDGIELLRYLADRGCRARVVVMNGVDQRIIESARHLGICSGRDIAAMIQKPAHASDLRAIFEQIKGGDRQTRVPPGVSAQGRAQPAGSGVRPLSDRRIRSAAALASSAARRRGAGGVSAARRKPAADGRPHRPGDRRSTRTAARMAGAGAVDLAGDQRLGGKPARRRFHRPPGRALPEGRGRA